ncbi:MAG: hypothetical protein WD595_05295 [Waddliaceae bacterium]
MINKKKQKKDLNQKEGFNKHNQDQDLTQKKRQNEQQEKKR